jgi:membrane protease YdiL (CAAX protease family)
MSGSDTMEATPSTGPAHWGFWATALWGIAIAVAYLVLSTIAVIAAVASGAGELSQSEVMEVFESAGANGYLLSLSTIVAALGCLGLTVLVIKLKSGSVLREYLHLRPVTLAIMLKWIGVLAIVISVSELITVALGRPIVPDFVADNYATASPAWMIWVALLIAAPVFEETFFRGFIFKGLESSRLRPLGAIVVTAGLWTAIHLQYDLIDMGFIFVLGLVFGASRLSTHSLFVPIALHSITNLVATAEAALVK